MQTPVDPVDPEVLVYAYRRGFFPMPHPETGEVLWFDPDPRTIIPLQEFHVSRSLRRSMRRRGYAVTCDQAFMSVVDRCAARAETWITEDFKIAYGKLHQLGIAHSVEVWLGDELVGGVFGLNFNGVFNAESMFHTKTDASKIALATLVEIMLKCRLALLEVQFLTPHLASLGAITMPRDRHL